MVLKKIFLKLWDLFNKKKYLGTLGDVGVFSFEFGKIITTGVGGMIFTNKKKIF